MGNALSTLWRCHSATPATPQSLADLIKSASGMDNTATTATTLLLRGAVVSRTATLSSIERSDPSIPPKHRCPFLELPVEIRTMVYSQVSPAPRIYLHGKRKRRGKTQVFVDDSELQDSMQLLATCKVVYQEAWPIIATSTTVHASGTGYRVSDLAPYLRLRVLPHVESMEFLRVVHLKSLMKMPRLKHVAAIDLPHAYRIRTPVALSSYDLDKRIAPLLTGALDTILINVNKNYISPLVTGHHSRTNTAILSTLAARGVTVACTPRFVFHIDIEDDDLYGYHTIELELHMDLAAYRVMSRQTIINGEIRCFSNRQQASEYLKSSYVEYTSDDEDEEFDNLGWFNGAGEQVGANGVNHAGEEDGGVYDYQSSEDSGMDSD